MNDIDDISPIAKDKFKREERSFKERFESNKNNESERKRIILNSSSSSLENEKQVIKPRALKQFK